MEEILKEVLNELKWHSKQNDKIIELLGKLRQPCGKVNSELLDLLKTMIPEGKGPIQAANILEQIRKIVGRQD